MISWLLKTKPVRKTKASKTSGIVKNISRKTLKGVTKKTRETTSSGLPRKQAYLDALSNYIRAATDHGQLGVEEQGLIDFGSTKIEGDTWHVTRVPEGPEIHLVLAKSEPHTGADFPRNIVNSLMQQIYKDLHEVSFDGITRYTTDLTPRRPQRNNVVS